MEDSEIQKRTIKLGEKLVKELKGQRLDTFARWMSHYIAEQMTIAKNAKGSDKIEAEERCFDAILKLWQHRSSWPDGLRPFKNFEPIFRALERLDPRNSEPYFRFNSGFDQFDSDEPAQKEIIDDVQQWLGVVKSIDQSARVCLNYAFQQAAISAQDDKTLEWIANAVDDLSKNGDISLVVRFIASDQLEGTEFAGLDKHIEQKNLGVKIQQLDTFIEFAQSLRAKFSSEIENL